MAEEYVVEALGTAGGLRYEGGGVANVTITEAL
jgi:hypothetical protein